MCSCFISSIFFHTQGTSEMTLRKGLVIGSPIRHSLSPSIFSFVASRVGFAHFEYDSKEVFSENLADLLQTIRTEKEWVGLNVTIPHKESILQYLDSVSPAVGSIGAANVIEKKEGRLIGHNTDVDG